jgi:hypothetical protein
MVAALAARAKRIPNADRLFMNARFLSDRCKGSPAHSGHCNCELSEFDLRAGPHSGPSLLVSSRSSLPATGYRLPDAF